jgi:hypothetical protein
MRARRRASARGLVEGAGLDGAKARDRVAEELQGAVVVALAGVEGHLLGEEV